MTQLRPDRPSGPSRPARLRRRRALAVATFVAFGGGLIGLSALNASAAEHKVTLCHATDSRTNPYALVTVDYHAAVFEGHSSHTGPIFSADLPAGVRWGDVIPPFQFGDDVSFAGQNWDAAGRDLAAAGCSTATTTTTVPPV